MVRRPPVLRAEELSPQLQQVPAWGVVDGRLHRRFEFTDFAEAFAFMTRVAVVAEELDHHPDWSNAWNRVDIDIVSHDAGGITELCVTLARRIDGLV